MGAYVAPLTGFLDAALTEYATMYRQHGLISDILAPRVLVGTQSGKWWEKGKEARELTEKTLRAPGARAERIRRALTNKSFFCDSHALEAEVPDEHAANYQLGDLVQDAVQDLMDKILLDKEKALIADATSTAVVTQNTTLAGTAQWSDATNSVPIADVELGKQTIRKAAGVEPNLMIIGETVYNKLIVHPKVEARFQYTKPGAIGVVELANVFAIDRVEVARAVETSAAGVDNFVWGKDALLVYVTPVPSRSDASAFKSFVWRNAPGTIAGIGVIRSRAPYASQKAELASADFYFDQQITFVAAAYLIKNAVA